MPKVSEMMKKGKFLKTEDIEEMGGEFEGTVVGVKEMNVAMENQQEQLKWVMKFRELEQLFVLNNTNLQLIEKALGTDDSAEWKGKTLTLYADPNVSMGGKLVGGIRVRVPAAKPKPTKSQDGEAAAERKGGGKPASFEDFEDDIPFLFNTSTVCDTMGSSKGFVRARYGQGVSAVWRHQATKLVL